MDAADRWRGSIPASMAFRNPWGVVLMSSPITKEIRKGLQKELKEDKRNRQIAKLLTGQRCPELKYVIKTLKGVHK